MKNRNFQNSGFHFSGNCVNCYRCGRSNHNSSVCWYKDKICNYCGKLGHIAKVCHSAHKQRTSQALHMLLSLRVLNNTTLSTSSSPNQKYILLRTPLIRWLVHVCQLTTWMLKCKDHNLHLELDTGSANTVVSERVWRSLGAPNLSTAPRLTAYGGFSIPILGSAQVTAKFKEEEKQHLPLVVVNRNSPSLL